MENSTANDRPELYEIETLASLLAVEARTMFQMVEEMQLPEIQSSYKVLFLTNEQSAILAEPAVDEKTRVPKMMRLFDAFELPQPSLVIFLLHSQGTPHVCNMRGAEVGNGHLRDSQIPGAPFADARDAECAEVRLMHYMKYVVIPLAIETKAYVICEPIENDCWLSKAFLRAVKSEQAKWHRGLPFSIIGLTSNIPFLYENGGGKGFLAPTVDEF